MIKLAEKFRSLMTEEKVRILLTNIINIMYRKPYSLYIFSIFFAKLFRVVFDSIEYYISKFGFTCLKNVQC